MYYELNEEEYLKIKEAEKTTLTNYAVYHLIKDIEEVSYE